jgi:hypothetical protein
MKLTHPAPRCLQSLQGSIPLREISKNLCINITQSTNDTVFVFSWNFFCLWSCCLHLPTSWLEGDL